MDRPLNSTGKLIAIVEDEAILRDVATAELEDRGFRVIEFETADAALPYLTENRDRVNLVITDVQMPGKLNGLQLVAIMAERCPRIAVLVTSGGPLVDPSKLPPRAQFIAKPWRMADMGTKVQSILAARH